MIEKTILNYLERNTGIPCYMEIPKEMPERFIVVEKTGSTRKNWIDSATIAVQSYDISMFKAAGVNQKVKSSMLAMADTEASIVSVSLNSDYNFTDTSTKRYRYQAVFGVTYYEED